MKTGRGGVGEALQAAHRRAELAQEGGELAQRGFQFGAAFGAGLGGGAGVGEEAGDVGAFARERAEDLLGVGGELGQLVALAS